MSNPEHQPGLYTKGGVLRRAYRPADAVALVFEGFKHIDQETIESDDVTYRDLQAAAKAVGIPANQSTEELLDALAAYENATAEPPPADES